MCGICGVFDPNNKINSPLVREDLKNVMNDFRYRGPDSDGIHINSEMGVGLGHVRLSIIDIGGGQQPMSNLAGDLWVTFNGEIYNYKEERAELISKGHQFRTNSDTEVILALYAQYGSEAWPRLRGQFAIGLWDAQKRKMILVRDRIGEKPLLYTHIDNTLYFASELKALMKFRAIPNDFDSSVFGMYILAQDVPAPFTLVKNVKKLPPGHYLEASSRGIIIKPFWNPVSWPENRHPSGMNLVEEFEKKFIEAVRYCTVSDVPIGTGLSGGIDSTAVTWAVKKFNPSAFHSFAIFNHDGHENHPDWRYAQEAAQYIGTQHHNVFYDLPSLMEQLPEYINNADEPINGPTALVSLCLAKFAQEHVKVLLTGNGADELLGGYQAYYQRTLKIQTAWQWLDRLCPQFIRKGVASVLGGISPKLSRVGLNPSQRRIDANLSYHKKWFDLVLPHLAQTTRDGFWQSAKTHRSTEQKNYFKRYLFEDIFIYHQNAITQLPDSTGMAVSLEARNPFLDYKLVEFLFSVSPDNLVRGSKVNKYLLVEAMKSKLPDSIRFRKKEGFSGMTGQQITNWIKNDGKLIFRDTLCDSILAKEGFLNQVSLSQLWKRYMDTSNTQESIYYQIPIWSIVTLELWYRRHFFKEKISF